VDDEFEAPADLFDAWETEAQAAHQIEAPGAGLSRAILRHAQQDVVKTGGSAGTRFETRWDDGFVPPASLKGRPCAPLRPRKGLGRLKQAYYLASRSLRQHNNAFFIGTCLVPKLP
jgi:hypothetical protein